MTYVFDYYVNTSGPKTIDFCLTVCSKTVLRLWWLLFLIILLLEKNHEVSHISDIVP